MNAAREPASRRRSDRDPGDPGQRIRHLLHALQRAPAFLGMGRLAARGPSARDKSATEGLVEALQVPYVYADTFALNPQAADVDIGLFDAVGPHIRWVLPMFTRHDVARIRTTPEDEWDLASQIACVWWVSPGLLLADEYYGLIYADLTPGQTASESVFRYGWLSPTLEAPEGLPSPTQMAARAAKAVGQDKPVWEGMRTRAQRRSPRLRADRAQ